MPYLAAIPTTWDETKVLDANVGEYAVFARQSGKSWHLGAMTDRRERTLTVPLSFLATGRFQAEIVADEESAKYGTSVRKEFVTANDRVTLKLSPAGGAYVRLVPITR